MSIKIIVNEEYKDLELVRIACESFAFAVMQYDMGPSSLSSTEASVKVDRYDT